MPGTDAPSRARQVLASGDVLVSTVRPNLNAVARVGEHLDGAIGSTGFCVLRPTGEIDGSYLFHWVRNPHFVAEMVRHATGASYPAITAGTVRESRIRLPPLREQLRIAQVLDAADVLRAKRRECELKLSQMVNALFLASFGNPASNPMDWRLAPLGTISEKFSDGPFGSNLKSADYVESGVRVVRLQNIGVGEFMDNDRAFVSDHHFSRLSKHECRPGDIMIATLGDPNLRACRLPRSVGRALNKADCVQMRVDRATADPRYVVALLNQPGLLARARTLMAGQTRVRISMGRLRALEVPVPPLELQERFGVALDRLQSLKSRYNAHLVHLDALFASLQSLAFKGEL